MRNINHKNYFDGDEKLPEVEEAVVEPVKEETVAVVEEPVIKEKELIVELEIDKEDVLFGLTKSEQVEILKNLGLTKKEIRKLSKEKQRVDKILSFVRK